MKKTVILLFLFAMLLLLCSCNVATNSEPTPCYTCGKLISGYDVSNEISYCPHCGNKLLTQEDLNKEVFTSLQDSDADKIIGTWQHIDPSWGLMEYVFYRDGFCKGSYLGKVGGVRPALYPDSYYEGSGDGYWYFIDGMLRIEYIGTEKGIMYHRYHFNEDGKALTIEGKGTYDSSTNTAVWEKIK